MDTRTKRIAKNTLALYARTFITMIVGLFTSRIMLEALGIHNYGIMNVVGGIVSFSSLITGTMTAATGRYITVALGEGNLDKMRTVFSSTLNVQIILGAIAVFFLEIAGVLFLNYGANLPADRMFAANVVLQISIASLFFSLVLVPFSSTIIAHEHMTLFAKLTVIDVIVKLGICYSIFMFHGDRLILLSCLNFLVQLGMMWFYIYYCRRNFQEVTYRKKIDGTLLKSMMTFSGWNLFGNTAWIFNTQGVNMLINIFFGVVYNATSGVANTVNSCIQGFVGSFTAAFSPQITKSYAAKEYDYCFTLANRASKATWFLMYLFIVPVFVEADTLLSLWLVEVPPMAPHFLRFTMFASLALSSGQSLYNIIQSDGNIKRYTIEVTLYGFVVFPLTWIAYKLGAPVWANYPIFIFIYFTLNIFRFRALSRISTYKWQSFITEALIPCLKVSVVSFILPLTLAYIWPQSLLRFFILVPISVISVLASVYVLGLTTNERQFIKEKVQTYIIRRFSVERSVQENG